VYRKFLGVGPSSQYACVMCNGVINAPAKDVLSLFEDNTRYRVCICVVSVSVIKKVCAILRAWFVSVNVSLCVCMCMQSRGAVRSLIRNHTKWLHASVPHLYYEPTAANLFLLILVYLSIT
jgi:hypothetical protein